MKVRHKLLLFQIVFSTLLLSILGINMYTNKAGIDLYIDNQTEKLTETIKISVSINNELLFSTVNDNTFWDEMRDFVISPDSNFMESILEPIVSFPHVDYLWAYNLESDNIFTTQKEGFQPIAKPIEPNYLFDIFDTIPNSSKRFANYYFKFDTTLCVVYGATVHATLDEERLLNPSGFLLLANCIDSKTLEKLGVITNSNVSILPNPIEALEYKMKNERAICAKYDLFDSRKQYIATLFFEKKDDFIAQNTAKQQKVLQIMIFVLLVSIVFIAVLFNTIFNKPIKSITESLDTNNLDKVKKYLNKNDEFGKISKLIESFFIQNSELEQEIEERKHIMEVISEKNDELQRQNDEITELNNENIAANEELRQQNEEINTLNEHISYQMEMVQEAESRLKTIINNQGEGFAILDLHENITFCNPMLCEMLDAKNKSLIDKDIKSFFSEKEYSKIIEQTKKSILNKKNTFELNFLANNHKKCFLVNGAPDLDTEGRIIGTIATFSDITRLKIEQEKTRKLNITLSKYFKAIEQCPVTIVFTDKNGLIEYANPRFTELTGYTPDEVNGKSPIMLASNKTDFSVYKELWRIITAGLTWEGEMYSMKKDGTIFIEKTIASPIYDHEDNIVSYIAIKEDITEKRQIEEEILRQKKTIEKAHAEIISSINYAKTIQQALLTSNDLIDKYLKNNFIFYQPKDNVGGDFYYVNQINNRIFIAAADCTGHGVAGAFLTIIGITYLHEAVKMRANITPAEILDILRERIKRTFKTFGTKNNNGLDIALCELNTDTKILQYAGANIPLWIVRNGQLIEHSATKNPIGYYPKEKPFENKEIQIENKDIMYLFSDGYKDQFGGEHNTKLKIQNFRNLILSVAMLEFSEQKNKIQEFFNNWKGQNEQVDDILVMAFSQKKIN